MVPATNEDALYSQLSQIRIHNLTRDSIKLVHFFVRKIQDFFICFTVV